MAETLDAARYCEPSLDTNRARWPDAPIWQAARREIEGDLFEMRSHLEPECAKWVYREEHRRMLLAQIDGLAVSLAGLDGMRAGNYGEHVNQVTQEVLKRALSHPVPLDERLAAAQDRYVFL